MPSVDKQIAAGRAKKQALLKKVAGGAVAIVIVGSLGAVTYQYLPVMTTSTPPPEQTESQTGSQTGSALPDRAALQQGLTTAKHMLREGGDARLTAWAPEEVAALSRRLDEAYTDYSKGEYTRVQASLQFIDDAFSSLQRRYHKRYKTLHEQALDAFDKNDIELASQRNRQALAVNPDFEPAVALRQRIDVFEKVQAMYEQARIGKVENNLQKQQQAFARIIELDPERDDAKASLARINEKLREEKFSQLLQRAVAAVDAGNLEEAQRLVDEAALLQSKSPEVVALQARIAKVRKLKGAEAAEQKVTMFSRLQEWKTVKMLAQDAISEYPNNAVIQGALDTANQILAAHSRLDRYLQDPARLADNNIRQRARAALTDIAALRSQSTLLNDKAEKLAQQIEQENSPLAVTVTSDGQSHLKVLGVGHIGEIEQKTIQLKPGNYTLEASREGYRTKLQELVVQKSAMPIVVHLACTEAI